MRKNRKESVTDVSPFLCFYEFVYMERERGEMKVDCASSVRLYVNAVLNEQRNALSLRSKELFLWLMMRVRDGDDLVIIDADAYMEEMGIESVKTVRKAINGLVLAGVIAKAGVKGVYFINALHFFKGSRVNKWPKQSLVWHERKVQGPQTEA